MEERNERERVCRIGEEGEVGNELVLCGYLQVVSGFGLAVVHGILLHAHEGGVMVCLGIGVAFPQYLQMFFVFSQLLTMGLKFLYPFPLFTAGLLLFLVDRSRFTVQGILEFIHYFRKHGRGKFHRCVLRGVLLRNGLIHLLQKDAYLVHQFCPVPFNALAPDKSVFVGLGLYLRTIDIFHVKADKAFVGKDEDQLGENVVDLILYAVAEAVNGDEIRLLITGKPDVMDITQQQLLYLAARVDIVHVSIENSLEHHFGMVRAAAGCLVKPTEIIKIKTVDNCIDYADRSIRSNIRIDSLRKKDRLVGSVRTKMYICHNF